MGAPVRCVVPKAGPGAIGFHEHGSTNHNQGEIIMTTHVHTSWGRTRSPKNIAGSQGTAATVIAHDANFSGITATDGTAGYVTEN